MTFFADQDRARLNTHKLVWLYCLAILCIILSIYLALLITFGGMTSGHSNSVRGFMPRTWWQPQLFSLATVSTLLVIGGASLLRLQAMKQGGAVVAQDLGGRLLLREATNSPEEAQLLNVVEEMAIAATMPVPPIYILDSENGINAFAAGYSPKNAVIGITRGCLEQLNREELQGVIGHEMSHILNGDMRLNAKLIAVLHGILFVYILGRLLASGNRRNSDKDGDKILYLGFALIVIGLIGHVFGRLIQSAVSRQREFLADASAVQFTRNPEGIAGALAKIEGNSQRSYVHAPYAAEMSHLFFGTALNFNGFGDWFATHPPIRQRIQRVESYWKRYGSSLPASQPAASVSSLPTNSMAAGFAATGETRPESTSRSPAPSVAKSTPAANPTQGLLSTPDWLAQVPETLRQIYDQQQAMAFLYTLLLETQNTTIRTSQENSLRDLDASLIDPVLQFSTEINLLEPRFRLLLLDHAIAILLQSSPKQCQQVLQTIQTLAKADGQWSISEFAVFMIFRERLQTTFALKPAPTLPEIDPEQLWSDCLLVLSAIAQAGTSKVDAITYAFRYGAYQLPVSNQNKIPSDVLPFQCGDFKKALDRLKYADSKLKRSLVETGSSMVMLDKVVTQSEAEVLWMVATVLGCPLPPFLNPPQGLTATMRSLR